MRIRVLLLAVILFSVLTTTLSAASITISLVQNESAPKSAIEMSRTVEDTLFDQFFSSGHIVSNTDIQFNGSLFEDKNYAVKEAAHGMTDYVIVVLLEYLPNEVTDDASKKSYAQLASVSWKLVHVSTSEKIKGEKIKITNKNYVNFDYAKSSKMIVQDLFPKIIAAIQTKSKGVSKQ